MMHFYQHLCNCWKPFFAISQKFSCYDLSPHLKMQNDVYVILFVNGNMKIKKRAISSKYAWWSKILWILVRNYLNECDQCAGALFCRTYQSPLCKNWGRLIWMVSLKWSKTFKKCSLLTVLFVFFLRASLMLHLYSQKTIFLTLVTIFFFFSFYMFFFYSLLLFFFFIL